MPEDSAPAALLVPTAKTTRATDFSIAAIMARGATPDSESLSTREIQPDGKSKTTFQSNCISRNQNS